TLSFHHLILDGWSVASLQTELLEDYLGRLQGKAVSLEAPRAQYRDYIAREQRALSSAASEQYWKEQLSGGEWRVPVLEARSGEKRGQRSARYTRVLDRELSAVLVRTARELGVQLKVLLLAGHVKVMSVLSGHRDVLTGVVWNGRLEEEDGDRALGLYLNSVPLRVRLQEVSWRGLIEQVRRQEQELVEHRRYPLTRIQEVLGCGELFNTLFNYVQFHVYERLSESGVIVGSEVFEATNYALVTTFSQSLIGERVGLSLGYDGGVLTPQQVERIAGYYESALQGICRELEGLHTARSLLSPLELEQVLRQFNAPDKSEWAQESFADRCIHELFEEQASRTPDAVAVVYEEQCLTYGQLNARANQLARYLRRQGVGAEKRVGLCVPRSPEMVIGLLGILKSGGAYVPLDPAYPAERQRYVLKDAQPVALVVDTVQGAAAQRGRELGVAVLGLDEVWTQEQSVAQLEGSEQDGGQSAGAEQKGSAQWVEEPAWPEGAGEQQAWPEEAAEDRAWRGNRLAYVMYTSGSTGNPKGVMVGHEQVLRL